MMTPHDLALAEVYRDALHRSRMTAVEVQAATGIPGRTFRNYLGTRNKPPRNPMTSTIQWQIAGALGVPASELMARAEALAATWEAPTAQERADAHRTAMSPNARALLDEAHPPEPDGDRSHDVG